MKLKTSGFVISNTTPLLYLHQIGLIHIIQEICGSILIPPAVLRELRAGRERGVDVPDISRHTWIQIVQPVSVSAHALIQDLGDGETEVLLLALEHAGSMVILDDNLARQYAYLNDIAVIGTCGLLLKAKCIKIIPEISSYLDKLERKGFFLSHEFREYIIRLAQEENCQY